MVLWSCTRGVWESETLYVSGGTLTKRSKIKSYLTQGNALYCRTNVRSDFSNSYVSGPKLSFLCCKAAANPKSSYIRYPLEIGICKHQHCRETSHMATTSMPISKCGVCGHATWKKRL